GLLSRRSLANHYHLCRLRHEVDLRILESDLLNPLLAHQAWIMVDAVGRTLYRLFIRRRSLLEWVAAAQTSDDAQFDPRGLASQIAASLGFAAIVAVGFYFSGQHAWPIAVPFAALWVLSPLVARWASSPPP